MALLLVVLCAVVTSGATQVASLASGNELDFKTEITQRLPYVTSDFVFTFDSPATPPNAPGGQLIREDVATNPALATLGGNGVSQAIVRVNPCGVILPHLHPRGTESAHITEGQLDFFFLEENQQRVLGGRIHNDQTIVLPVGTVHFAVNPLCQPAKILASFDHRDAGGIFLNAQLFSALVPNNIITASTGLNDDIIARVRAFNKDKGLSPGVDRACLERCGLA